jgi:hypothetical protein
MGVTALENFDARQFTVRLPYMQLLHHTLQLILLVASQLVHVGSCLSRHDPQTCSSVSTPEGPILGRCICDLWNSVPNSHGHFKPDVSRCNLLDRTHFVRRNTRASVYNCRKDLLDYDCTNEDAVLFHDAILDDALVC